MINKQARWLTICPFSSAICIFSYNSMLLWACYMMPSIFRVGCSERWVEAMSAKLEELNSQFLFFVPLASCFWQLNSRHNYKLGFDILRRYLDNNDRWQGKRWRLINCRQGVLASSALALYRTTPASHVLPFLGLFWRPLLCEHPWTQSCLLCGISSRWNLWMGKQMNRCDTFGKCVKKCENYF